MLTTIQVGRACAALAVAAFHLSVTMGVERYGGVPVLQEWTYRGDLGVDYFFVLSGFVIMMAHSDDIGSHARVGQYLWKRFVRVYPIYLLYTVVFVALVLLGLGNNTPLPQSPAGWISAFILVRLSPEAPPIAPAWTLFHEVGFYALFATLILSWRIGSTVFVAWVAMCLLLWQYPSEGERTLFAVFLSAYALHFLLGMFAYVALRFLRDRWKTGCAVGLFGIAVFVVGDAVSTEDTPLIAWACGFSGILLTAAFLEIQFDVHAPRWLRYIGDASYSLYLLHIPVQGLLLKVLIKSQMAQVLGGIGTYVAVMVGTTLLGCLAYKWIESPLLRALRASAHAKPCQARMAPPGATP